VRVGIAKSRSGPWRTVRVLVDTGADDTVLPRRVLRAVGVESVGTRTFRVGDRRLITRELGDVFVRYDGEVAPTTVVFGGPRDFAVLGALTLEELHLVVDPKARRLRKRRELLFVAAVPP